MNIAINGDCMEVMRQYPDKYFDLAVVDPPYGSGNGEFESGTRFGGRFDRYKTVERTGRTWAKDYGKKIVGWDVAPGEDYFAELFRVSKEQIIWGGNYFGLPPNRCFLVWKKTNIPENFSMAMAEYAWCSMNENATNKADIIGWYSGHIHRDRIYTGVAVNTTDDSVGAEMPFTQVTITSDHTGIAYDAATKHTVANDDQSHAIDFVTINRNTRTVALTRLGIGEDRSYAY